jgi:hypothetical protein
MTLVDLMDRARRNPAASEEAVVALTHFVEHQRKSIR